MYTVSMIPFPDSGFRALVLSKLVQCNMTKIMSLPKKMKGGKQLVVLSMFRVCYSPVIMSSLYIPLCSSICLSWAAGDDTFIYQIVCKIARIRSSFCWSRQNILQGWIQDFSCTTKEWHN